MQRTGKGGAGYSGIAALLMQDAAMTTSMGGICERPNEHLGSTDAMVIQIRARPDQRRQSPHGARDHPE